MVLIFYELVQPGLDLVGVLFRQQWTFSHAFWEKMDFFACILGKSGPFCMLFLEKVDFFECSAHVRGMFPGKIWKNMIEYYTFRDIMIHIVHSKL